MIASMRSSVAAALVTMGGRERAAWQAGEVGYRPGDAAYRRVVVALFAAGVTTFALLYSPPVSYTHLDVYKRQVTALSPATTRPPARRVASAVASNV